MITPKQTDWIFGFVECGEAVYLRSRQKPWRPLTAPLTDYAGLCEALTRYGDAALICTDPKEPGLMNLDLKTQQAIFRRDDAALEALARKDPQHELDVYYAILHGASALPVYPKDRQGRCLCRWECGQRRHPIFSAGNATDHYYEVFNMFVSVPGIRFCCHDAASDTLTDVPSCPWTMPFWTQLLANANPGGGSPWG